MTLSLISEDIGTEEVIIIIINCLFLHLLMNVEMSEEIAHLTDELTVLYCLFCLTFIHLGQYLHIVHTVWMYDTREGRIELQ